VRCFVGGMRCSQVSLTYGPHLALAWLLHATGFFDNFAVFALKKAMRQ
jgi:hypothetical protein